MKFAPLALVALLLDASVAQTTTCLNTISGGVVTGDIVVSSNTPCTLDGVTVTGSVLAASGSLLVIQGSNIGGNVVGTDLLRFVVDDDMSGNGSVISGSVKVSVPGFQCSLSDSRVDGNLSMMGSSCPLAVNQTTVLGNVSIESNTFDSIDVRFLQVGDPNDASSPPSTVNINSNEVTDTHVSVVDLSGKIGDLNIGMNTLSSQAASSFAIQRNQVLGSINVKGNSQIGAGSTMVIAANCAQGAIDVTNNDGNILSCIANLESSDAACSIAPPDFITASANTFATAIIAQCAEQATTTAVPPTTVGGSSSSSSSSGSSSSSSSSRRRLRH